MELDWGLSCFDGDDDFVQSYDAPTVESVCADIDEIYSSDEDLESTISTKKGTNNKRVRSTSRGSRKKKKKKSGAEYFYEIILRWSIPLLVENDRRRLCLPSLHSQPKNFSSPLQYYQSLQILPIEESRVSLVRGMESPVDTFFMSISHESLSNAVFNNVVGLSILDFDHSSSQWDIAKPGFIYFLFPVISEACAISIHSKADHIKRRNTPRSELAEQVETWGKNALMATLCLSSSSCETYNKTSQSFWIHNLSLSNMDSCYRSSRTFPTRWKAYAIENLITYQRMIASCHDAPKPPFLSGLLGHKLPVHVRFGDDEYTVNERMEAPVEVDILVSSSESNICSSDDSSVEDECNRCTSGVGMLRPLDSSQQVAMESIMGARGSGLGKPGALHMVQGPPGCGKTFFMVHLLHRIVDECNSRQRVLVCAPSNKAVCVAIERFRGSSAPGTWKNHPVVLVGVQDKIDNCSNTSVSSYSLPEVWEPSGWSDSISNQAAHSASSGLVAVVRDEMNRMWKRSLSLHSESEQRSTTSLQPLGVVSPALLRAVGSVSDPETAPDVLIYTYSQRVGEAVQGIAAAFDTCVEAITNSPPSKQEKRRLMALVLTALNGVTDLYYDLSDTLSTVAPYLFKESIGACHQRVCQGLQKLSEAVEYDALAGKEEVPDAWSALKGHFSEMSSLFFDGYTDNQLTRELLRSAVVVCSTLSSAGCGLMKSSFAQHGFDMLLVDEAGQCLECELAIPFIYEPRQLVLIGDPRQLPATVLSYEAQRLEMGMSTMQRLMYHCDAPFHLLTTQYRMHPDICQFPNDRFYGGELLTDVSVHQRCNLHVDLLDHFSIKAQSVNWLQPYVFVNVSHTESSGGFGGKSKSNIGEAKMIARLVSTLGQIHGSDIYSRIGVITFYAGQVSVLKRTLLEHGVASDANNDDSTRRNGVKVMSVDGFQGSEADIIFISFVRCNASSNVGFVDDFQRLNVSLTRAKHILIMVGCTKTLETSGSTDLQQLVTDARDRGSIIEDYLIVSNH